MIDHFDPNSPLYIIVEFFFLMFYLQIFNSFRESWNGESLLGLPTPPHSVIVDRTTPEIIELSWTTPVISHPEDSLKYRFVSQQYMR